MSKIMTREDGYSRILLTKNLSNVIRDAKLINPIIMIFTRVTLISFGKIVG